MRAMMPDDDYYHRGVSLLLYRGCWNHKCLMSDAAVSVSVCVFCLCMHTKQKNPYLFSWVCATVSATNPIAWSKSFLSNDHRRQWQQWIMSYVPLSLCHHRKTFCHRRITTHQIPKAHIHAVKNILTYIICNRYSHWQIIYCVLCT